MRIYSSKPYRPLYQSPEHNIVLNCPRLSGKSYEVSQFGAYSKMLHKNHDGIVFRANANSLLSSVVNDTLEKFVSLGWGERVRIRQAPLRIELDGGRSNIYFLGVSGHDKSRVRGFHPKNPLAFIIGDECQQISSEENLKHALASFRRYLDTSIDYKILLCGNPHEVKGHWWNVYAAKHKGVKGYESIYATYLDIYDLINDADREEIALEKKINPALYRFMYLGDLSDINGSAYPSFRRERHLITPQQAGEIFKGERIECLIIGGDGAITHDMTCLTPIAVMSSGRACTLEPFIFNPLSYGRALAPSELADLIKLYMGDMEQKYGFQRNFIPVHMFIDCASEDLITQLSYDLDGYYNVGAYTTKNVIRNTSTANNVFARNMVYIIDYGGYKDYASGGRWVETDIPLLAEQLENVTWKNSKLDPAIPNDCSDSFVYGACVYYENPENLNLPERNDLYDQFNRP